MVELDRARGTEKTDQGRSARLIVLVVALVIATFVLTEVRADAELDREVRDLAVNVESLIGADPGEWARNHALELLEARGDTANTRAAAQLRAVAGSDASLFSLETLGQSDDLMAVFRATSWWRDRCATLWVVGGFVSWDSSACP